MLGAARLAKQSGAVTFAATNVYPPASKAPKGREKRSTRFLVCRMHNNAHKYVFVLNDSKFQSFAILNANKDWF